MSKSRGNTIELGASADETAALIRRARTDREQVVTYEPQRRPEVANLLTIAAACTDTTPQQVAAQIGGHGAMALTTVGTDAGAEATLAEVRDVMTMTY